VILARSPLRVRDDAARQPERGSGRAFSSHAVAVTVQVSTREIATTANSTIAAAITKSYRSGLNFFMTPTLGHASGLVR